MIQQLSTEVEVASGVDIFTEAAKRPDKYPHH